ncbi:MAG: hypothetical protein EPN93_02255 [Spirochaetes bacterium]|nr:MAG: hypothetical protein EPN93_02255 [Spirochaetota bacterium]
MCTKDPNRYYTLGFEETDSLEDDQGISCRLEPGFCNPRGPTCHASNFAIHDANHGQLDRPRVRSLEYLYRYGRIPALPADFLPEASLDDALFMNLENFHIEGAVLSTSADLISEFAAVDDNEPHLDLAPVIDEFSS